MGIGKATSSSGNTYVVANYLPPGNFEGEYQVNVLPLNSKMGVARPPRIGSKNRLVPGKISRKNPLIKVVSNRLMKTIFQQRKQK